MSDPTAWQAHNRFGLGTRPEFACDETDGRALLAAQLQRADASHAAFRALPTSASLLQRESAWRRERAASRRRSNGTAGAASDDASGIVAMPPTRNAAAPDTDGFRATFGADQRAELAARYTVALTTPQGFVERLVQFWSNHFAVSVDKRPAALYAAPMEREAIRPHLFGGFADLLQAVTAHPAMLRYLDNAQSIGDASPLAVRIARHSDRTRGLNENLAREVLELHTLGVDGGYTQADVTELARALTGWGTATPRERGAAVDASTGFVFRAAAHEGGVRTVLGKRYPDEGVAQARSILRDLARHPATARHLATKLATHFVADVPPPALVQRLAAAFERDGRLDSLYRALIDAPESWRVDARKFKTPNDVLVSALRALDAREPPKPDALAGMLARLGQPPFLPRSPAGFPDTAADWNGADALWKRVQLADTLAQRYAAANASIDATLARARAVLGPALDADTTAALRRAESPQQAMALLLACPAFQWRT